MKSNGAQIIFRLTLIQTSNDKMYENGGYTQALVYLLYLIKTTNVKISNQSLKLTQNEDTNFIDHAN